MKGHSERIPNKNMKIFAGSPLFHSIMKSLTGSKYIQKIVINTDSQVIAENATQYFNKVEIVWRPESICGDFVSMNKIIEHDLQQYSNDFFLQTHSTNPLLTQKTIDRAIFEFFASLETYDSLFSVNRLQTRLYWENAEPVNHNINVLERTQDLPPIFEENSNIYIFSKKSFLASDSNRIGKSPKMFEMNKIESIDIDEEQDFQLAETLYLQRTKS